MTKFEFVEKSTAIHGTKYNYDTVVYLSNKRAVSIICPDHGVFNQIPSNHMRGKGCPFCGNKSRANSNRLSKSEFVEKAQLVHGEKYGYHQVDYTGSHNKVKITCHIHGVFKQSPANHLQGYGCVHCAGLVKHNNDSFTEKAKSVHGNQYDYSLIEYVSNDVKVKINCHEHGVFEQEANSHLQGSGCPGCGKYGFDQTKPGFVYMLRSRCGHYVKIGITHKPDQRHAQLAKSTPFEFNRIELIEGTGSWVADMEKKLLSMSEPVVFQQPFDGYTEWRLWSEDLRNTLTSF